MENVIESGVEKHKLTPHSWLTSQEYNLFRPIFEPGESALRQGTPESTSDSRENDEPEISIEILQCLRKFTNLYMNPLLHDKVECINQHGESYLIIAGPNCQSFALKTPVDFDGSNLDHKPYPGYYAGLEYPEKMMDAINSGDIVTAKQEIVRLIGEDVKAMGGELVEVDKDYQCAEGEWKICMMGSSSLGDYHFMREELSVWFQKEGNMEVSCLDNDQKLITDPEHCKTNYEQFYGYFAVRNAKGTEDLT